jgi:glucose-6-phosphate 1-dehydrogenase
LPDLLKPRNVRLDRPGHSALVGHLGFAVVSAYARGYERDFFMASAQPCVIVIFGASGDLAKLKLIPAVYELAREGLLPADFALVGYARTKMSDDDFRAICRDAISKFSRSAKKTGVDNALLDRLLAQTTYHAGQYGDLNDFASLKTRLDALDTTHKTLGNRLFYMSTPPEAFEPIIVGLGKSGLVLRHAEKPWNRLIIEKPFGTDLKSAQHLNAVINATFGEEQVFRIDHYLGKETVQNLMVLRFANSIFEPMWNHKYIDHIQITVGESVNADDRAGYYDKSGALRDMVQNHIFQLMALVAMEPPALLDARSIRDEKTKVYKSIRPIRENQVDSFVVRGQYGAGEVNGKRTEGYLKAKGVDAGSRTETFAALKLFIDNWRWSGTPFYIRTGKCMPSKVSEVAVRFRAPPLTLFQKQCETPVYPNDLVIKVAPEEGITWQINGKVPGGALNIQPVQMDFLYNSTFKKEAPEAYERLIFDSILGDQSLFIRGDEAEAAWSVIDPIENGWKQSPTAPFQYEPGTWGPRQAMDLIELDGRRWRHSSSDMTPIIACAV